jgi:hypothetical protein
MKIKEKEVLILFLFLSYILFSNCKRSRQSNKFDKEYKNCSSSTECSNKKYDESCIYKCISKKCYDKFLSNYIFEFGETNYFIKSNFESCFYNR